MDVTTSSSDVLLEHYVAPQTASYILID